MAEVRAVDSLAPFIGKGTWLAPSATVVGDVHIGQECSVWYQAVIRGDAGAIILGDMVNIQDGAILHCTTNKSTIKLGDRVTVGHRAIVHGCSAEDDVLIGMGAIVLDNAYLESGCIVAAGAVVLENTRVPAGTIWAGVPAVQVKVNDMEKAVAGMRLMAESYAKYKTWYEDLKVD